MKPTHTSSYSFRILFWALILLATSTSVFANTVGLGIARAPEYIGSDDYQFFPQASFEIDTRVGTFRNEGVGAKLDVLNNQIVETGPVIRLNIGRDDSVDDELVSLLPEVSATAEAGWYIGSGFKLHRLGLNSNAIAIGELSVVSDIGDGHRGTLVEASMGLVLPISDSLRVIPSVSLTYADDKYSQAFYGVDSDASAASGLAQFSASGGIESSQLALVVIRTLSERWSLSGTVAYSVLQGDAADSPVTQRGDDAQLFMGIVANYGF